MTTVFDRKPLAKAKEAAYTAVGLNLLVLDEMSERFTEATDALNQRFAGPRTQVEKEFDVARKQATTARADLRKQLDETTDKVKAQIPAPVSERIDSTVELFRKQLDQVEDLAEKLQEQVQANAAKGWKAVEPTLHRIAGYAPEPVEKLLDDTVTYARGMVVAEETPVVASRKPAARKAPAKTTARKPAARKTTARKPAARKAS